MCASYKEWLLAAEYIKNGGNNNIILCERGIRNNISNETRKQFLKEIEDAGGHATPKPIALCSRAIKSSSREGEIVLDVFGGSGSTLIACENTGRNCYICEIEPRWCNVIIDRWEKMTGKVAFKVE